MNLRNSLRKLVFSAFILWALGYVISACLLAGTFTKIKHDYQDALKEKEKILFTSDGSLSLKTLLEERMHEVVTRGDCWQSASETQKSNAKRDIDQALNDFFDHDAEEMASLYRPVGGLYVVLDNVVKHTLDCEGDSEDAIGGRRNFTLDDLSAIQEERFHQMQQVGTEIYVLDWSRDLVWWSVGLFVLSTILSAAFEVYDKNNTDQEIVHWVYTSAQYLAIFASVIVYTMAITREFWMRPWSLIGVLSTGTVDSVQATTTSPGASDVNVPFKFWNSRLHKNTEILVICSFVFQMLYLAAHQAMKYGPLVSKEESILKDLTTGAKTANKAKTGLKVKYSPLISVAR